MKKLVRLLLVILTITIVNMSFVTAELIEALPSGLAKSKVGVDSLMSDLQYVTGYYPEYDIDENNLIIHWHDAEIHCENAITLEDNVQTVAPEVKNYLVNFAYQSRFEWYESDCMIYWNGKDGFNLNGDSELYFDLFLHDENIILIHEGSLMIVAPDEYKKDSGGYMIPLKFFSQALYNWYRYINED